MQSVKKLVVPTCKIAKTIKQKRFPHTDIAFFLLVGTVAVVIVVVVLVVMDAVGLLLLCCCNCHYCCFVFFRTTFFSMQVRRSFATLQQTTKTPQPTTLSKVCRYQGQGF